MQDPYSDNQSGVAYQAPTEPAMPITAPHQAVPGQMHTPPTMPPVYPRRSNGMRTGAIIALSIVLLVVLGVGLFAGWQFGRTSTSTGGASSSVATLQPGTGPQSTVPPLTGNNEQAVREAVIAKVRPAVVEVNVTTQQGGAIGSGVIIDGRGYIVTNNHVVSGAQSMTVTLYDGTNLKAQLVGTDPTDDLAVI
ncbi:MAG: S1C family serine protease, partial [Ktedonobacteraceae bacterium]